MHNGWSHPIYSRGSFSQQLWPASTLLHLFFLLRRGWSLQLADLYITIDTIQTTDRHELELRKEMEYNQEKKIVLKGLGTKYSCQVIILPLQTQILVPLVLEIPLATLHQDHTAKQQEKFSPVSCNIWQHIFGHNNLSTA